MPADIDKRAIEYVENAVLMEDEKILWRGRPDPARSAAVDLKNGLFGIFFFVFAIFWMASTSQAGAPFTLFSLPFLAVGAWMVSKPARTFWRAGRTYYAITDERVLIATIGRTNKLDVVFPVQIRNYERTDKSDGTGSIKLRTTISSDRGRDTTSTEFSDGLWGITDVKGAADAIAQLQAAG